MFANSNCADQITLLCASSSYSVYTVLRFIIRNVYLSTLLNCYLNKQHLILVVNLSSRRQFHLTFNKILKIGSKRSACFFSSPDLFSSKLFFSSKNHVINRCKDLARRIMKEFESRSGPILAMPGLGPNCPTQKYFKNNQQCRTV